MKLIITPIELMEFDLWTEYCELSGTNFYAINEGMDSKTPLELTEDEADQIGLRIIRVTE
jgi:hypothetical protein